MDFLSEFYRSAVLPWIFYPSFIGVRCCHGFFSEFYRSAVLPWIFYLSFLGVPCFQGFSYQSFIGVPSCHGFLCILVQLRAKKADKWLIFIVNDCFTPRSSLCSFILLKTICYTYLNCLFSFFRRRRHRCQLQMSTKPKNIFVQKTWKSPLKEHAY